MAGRIHLWGTRGSVPVSGPRYAKHGGNTSCVSLECGDDIIIFDAGTGIRELGVALAGRKPQRLHLFISHAHWDHIQGFPFFAPDFIPGWEIVIYGASGFGKDMKALFQGQLDRDYFPVQMEDLKVHLEFRTLTDGVVRIGNAEVTWEYAHHPGSALGYKVAYAGKTLAYLSDNEFLPGYYGPPGPVTRADAVAQAGMIDFLSGVDLLVGEAQYTDEEYPRKTGWGHSSVSNACVLARLAKVKRWIITHHDPAYDDDFLQQKLADTQKILDGMKCPVQIEHGFDGMREDL